MKKETNFGLITLNTQVFSDISARAAMGCFGVKGLAGGTIGDDLSEMLTGSRMKRGVRLRFDEQDNLLIDLHIIVENGVNIAVLCKNIISQVTYQVSRQTGVQVARVNVNVDGIAY